jgi:hypothetical protein
MVERFDRRDGGAGTEPVHCSRLVRSAGIRPSRHTHGRRCSRARSASSRALAASPLAARRGINPAMKAVLVRRVEADVSIQRHTRACVTPAGSLASSSGRAATSFADTPSTSRPGAFAARRKNCRSCRREPTPDGLG